MEQEENRFTIEYKTDREMLVDMSDMAKSMQGWVDQYEYFIQKKYDGKTDSRLLITAVRGNSIDFYILQTAAEVAPLFATGLDFLKAILPAIEYLLGDKTKDVPTKTEVKNIQNIITPSINGGVSEIHVRGNGNTVNININYNDANKINNTAEDMLISEDIKSTEHYTKRHLRFYQARDAKSKTGNQSIADGLSKKPVNTSFSSESIKNQMLHPQDNNIFDVTFLVDMDVIYKDQRVSEYIITKVHNVIPIEKTQRLPIDNDLLDNK